MLGIIGKKLGMTQIFNEQGQQIPCTVVEAKPNPVVQVIGAESDKPGFAAVQLGYGSSRTRREAKKGEKKVPHGHRATAAALGHATKAGLAAAPRVLRSFRLDDMATAPEYKLGDTVDISIFQVGELVKVTGTSKGGGFQGIVKRHKAGGGPNTHGNTKHRRPGSIGAGTDPSRVIKGKRMPGQHGNVRHTQINLRVEKVDTERNLLYIRGSVSGATNGIVMVRKQGQ
ncbi:MAG: 50S ribosomal protein L3 [Gemmatimonadaceae bacterium]|nr:50S ribosomal protein L3 [Gemmatimonadaceae bacterium]